MSLFAGIEKTCCQTRQLPMAVIPHEAELPASRVNAPSGQPVIYQ